MNKIQNLAKMLSFSLVFSLVVNGTFAQLNPRSTLYTYHQSSYNPAVCGAGEYGSVSAVVRKQYLGFADNAGPATTWFDFTMPIKKLKSGVGLSIAQTSQGFESRTTANLSYAYQLDLGAGRLGFGLSAGLNSAKWDLSSAVYPDGASDAYLSETIGSRERFNNFLLGFGMNYQYAGLRVAFAITELNEPALKFDSGNMDYLKRHYWLSAGYEYKTSSPKWILYPATTIKTTFADWQASFDLRTIYNNMVICGLSYTSSNDVSLNVGVQFKNGSRFDGLRALFSYDILTSKIAGESAGSLEFMVSYDFNLFVEKDNKTYKSVRFL